MTFSPQFLDELRARAGLADVIARRVKLTRRGREHVGLCPFHKEKTPSFTVNEEKGFYHCFGCGEHGSVIDFVMKTEGLAFPEAVERLAAAAGMEVPVDSPEERERARRRQSLYEVVEAACVFFEKSLRMPEGGQAMAYLAGRGVDDAAQRRFRLGYAPERRGALKAALAGHGITEEQMAAAGLVKHPEDGRPAFDYFRRRIVFPITDRRGRVIAFGGRILGDGEPKYLNSPETPLFTKGRVVYGLAQAAAAAREKGRIVVAEGYMDVIALSGAGIDEAVAPLGTALTEDQMGELWRLAREPVLCFDGDAAGGRAAAAAASRVLPLLKPGYSLRFALMPEGEDPDSLIRKEGAAAVERVLDAALPLSEALWRLEARETGARTPEDRAALQKRLEDHALRIGDPMVRGHFLRDFKDRLWERPRATGATGAAGATGTQRAWAPVAARRAAPAGAPVADLAALRERILLAVVITHPELCDDVGERLGTMEFSATEVDKLRQEVLKTVAEQPGLDWTGLERHLKHSGFSETLDSLLSAKALEHAFFARPDAASERAREGWEETYALYMQKDLRAEIEEAGRRLAEDPSAESYGALCALQEQEQRTREEEDAFDRRVGALVPARED
ncbi:MAG: DNA primase [Rhodospirillales bacterium]|jgi:DNA primase|nr:DNA primase [Rhodospirillales bacterium]MDP6774959.1 DNA primase [Rhodospirillales bacterium]